MEIILRGAVIAVIGSILALLLRKNLPEMALLTVLSAGLMIFWLSASLCAKIIETLREIAENGAVSSIYLAPVLKCVGIGLVTHLAAQLCRDAQQGSAASAVELCGTLCALYISLPLFELLLSMVGRLV